MKFEFLIEYDPPYIVVPHIPKELGIMLSKPNLAEVGVGAELGNDKKKKKKKNHTKIYQKETLTLPSC